MTASNQAKTELKQKLIRDTKAHIGLALLEAFETNAPLTFERMKAHVLVAAAGAAPAKYDGVAIFTAYQGEAGANDATRQDEEAEKLTGELAVTLPDNVTGTQFAVHLGKFNDKSKPRLLRALTPELHVKWIIDRLPEKLSADQRNIRRTLRATGKAADVTEAMKQCVVEACDDAYDPTIGPPDVGACMSKRLGAVRNHFQAGATGATYNPTAEVKLYVASLGADITRCHAQRRRRRRRRKLEPIRVSRADAAAEQEARASITPAEVNVVPMGQRLQQSPQPPGVDDDQPPLSDPLDGIGGASARAMGQGFPSAGRRCERHDGEYHGKHGRAVELWGHLFIKSCRGPLRRWRPITRDHPPWDRPALHRGALARS